MISLVLMQNTKKMLEHNVLVRKAVGIETAGSLNILFSDKTGTITKGSLEVVEFFTANGDTIPFDEIKNHGKIKTMLDVAIGMNSASMYDGSHKVIGGNATDQALMRFLGEDNYRLISSDSPSVGKVSDTEGITISGGEPFLQAEELATMIDGIKAKRDYGVIIYTGFLKEELDKKNENGVQRLLLHADILIDGHYIKELDDGKPYRGSSNQNIYLMTDRYKPVFNDSDLNSQQPSVNQQTTGNGILRLDRSYGFHMVVALRSVGNKNILVSRWIYF